MYITEAQFLILFQTLNDSLHLNIVNADPFTYQRVTREQASTQIVNQNQGLMQGSKVDVPVKSVKPTPEWICKCGHPLACHAFEGCRCFVGENVFCKCLSSHDRELADEMTCTQWQGVAQKTEEKK